MGPNKIPVPPLAFAREGDEFVSITYLGTDLCGHVGMVHGGMLATMIDEGLARCCFAALPNRIGVTASLTIDYRSPTKAGSYVVLKAKTTKAEGRKAWVEGRIETLGEGEEPGKVLVEATGLYVEPRYASVGLDYTLDLTKGCRADSNLRSWQRSCGKVAGTKRDVIISRWIDSWVAGMCPQSHLAGRWRKIDWDREVGQSKIDTLDQFYHLFASSPVCTTCIL